MSNILIKSKYRFVPLILIIIIIFGIYYFVKNQQVQVEKNDTKVQLDANEKIVKKLGCTRKTRLDNKPPHDRALSLIEEKYKLWEKSGEGKGSWYFFPSELVNCIKVIESDVRNKTGAEGHFIFNDSKIKENYFPITLDKDYSYADDSINSLILVHEITHVEQYINSLNKSDGLTCIDKEVEAFYAQWKFYGIQFPEARKSIDYRIENDKDLHPQLQMLSVLKNNFDIDGVSTECFYGSGKNDTECIDKYRKNEIKQILVQDDFYRTQCKL
ncbi:MAG TPA: hypothetical protein VM077_01100 [Candidatus Limnocylindrales bacterium]|nr:hypothetical protein [Candidatus Limnocylindrales bacterium]